MFTGNWFIFCVPPIPVNFLRSYCVAFDLLGEVTSWWFCTIYWSFLLFATCACRNPSLNGRIRIKPNHQLDQWELDRLVESAGSVMEFVHHSEASDGWRMCFSAASYTNDNASVDTWIDVQMHRSLHKCGYINIYSLKYKCRMYMFNVIAFVIHLYMVTIKR